MPEHVSLVEKFTGVSHSKRRGAQKQMQSVNKTAKKAAEAAFGSPPPSGFWFQAQSRDCVKMVGVKCRCVAAQRGCQKLVGGRVGCGKASLCKSGLL